MLIAALKNVAPNASFILTAGSLTLARQLTDIVFGSVQITEHASANSVVRTGIDVVGACLRATKRSAKPSLADAVFTLVARLTRLVIIHQTALERRNTHRIGLTQRGSANERTAGAVLEASSDRLASFFIDRIVAIVVEPIAELNIGTGAEKIRAKSRKLARNSVRIKGTPLGARAHRVVGAPATAVGRSQIRIEQAEFALQTVIAFHAAPAFWQPFATTERRAPDRDPQNPSKSRQTDRKDIIFSRGGERCSKRHAQKTRTKLPAHATRPRRC